MTIQQAFDQDYYIRKESPYRISLVKGGISVRTWWIRDFAGKMPKLDHSLVQEAIRLNEPPVAPGELV